MLLPCSRVFMSAAAAMTIRFPQRITHLATKAGAPTNGQGIGEWPSFVPDANGKRGTRGAYSLIPLLYFSMGAVLLPRTSHSIFRQRSSKFESSQQILAGILFIIVYWPGKDIPHPQRTEGPKGDRQGGSGSSLSTCQKWWANNRTQPAQLLPFPLLFPGH